MAPYFYPYTGGAETAAWEMAKSLVEDHGVEVEVHTSWYGGPDRKIFAGVTLYLDGGLSVRRYRSPSRVVCFRPRVSEDCSVLHVLGFHRLLVAATVLSERRRVAVLQPHGNVSQVPGEPPGLVRSLRLLADRTVSRSLVSRFSAVLCLNEREQLAMERVGVPPGRIRLLRAPVPLKGSDGGIDVGSARDLDLFLSVGRVTPLKYIEHAITALARVPRARLMVIGPCVDEGYRAKLVSLVHDLRVEERVCFLGALPTADLRRWYSQSAGVVLCSRSEGQGLVLSEAALHGSVPILARGASDELVAVTGCGLLYRWGDTQELARRLEEVMGKHASFEPALARARAFVEAELAPSAVAAKLLAIYQEVDVGV